MSYIDKNLLAGEEIIFRTKKHLILFFWPLVWTLVASYIAPYIAANNILQTIAWVPWLLVAFFWVYAGLEYMTSDFAVTNRRVLMREGFLYRHTNETRLAAISQVNVVQSLLGQLLNYGTVSINAFGAFDAFPLIAHPFQFQKHVNEALDKVVR